MEPQSGQPLARDCDHLRIEIESLRGVMTRQMREMRACTAGHVEQVLAARQLVAIDYFPKMLRFSAIVLEAIDRIVKPSGLREHRGWPSVSWHRPKSISVLRKLMIYSRRCSASPSRGAC